MSRHILIKTESRFVRNFQVFAGRLSMVDWKRHLTRKLLFFFQIFFGFGWGALPARPLGFWLGGQSPPRNPPLNGRSSHLIEAAKRGRLDQMILFSAPLTTRASPGRPAERPAWYGSHQFEQTYVWFERFTFLYAYRKYQLRLQPRLSYPLRKK